MFTEGIIKNYNAERGFGFIKIEGKSEDIFFHISAFPKSTEEPKIGERLKFLIVEDKGKFKATNIVRLDINGPPPVDNTYRDEKTRSVIGVNQPPSNKKSIIFTIVCLVIIAVLMGLVFKKYQAYQQAQSLKTARLMAEQKRIVEAQRKAIGNLPEVKFSEKTENALKYAASPTIYIQQQPAVAQNQFTCDGRTHCSQMGSYEEAVFFIKYCPNTKMDGDHDGEPCENDSRW